MNKSRDSVASAQLAPFDVSAIDHIVLRVADLERSINFYNKVLGCELDRRRPELGMVHMRAGASMIDLLDINGPIGGGSTVDQHRANFDHFCLRIDHFDETSLSEYFHAHQVAIELPAQDRYGAQGVGLSIYIHDPDGNRVELKQVIS
ncbi:VOC family protein [Acetobacter indonesiensis]|uniref:VOC family protein n=1 Tax=Acetobacter indonesiensis TaxID=104101 RepID=UPI0020A2EA02|nr:VOC family protein [Acetobacter indonesiensis]MCP1232024.1 VOC family protein [Acetobacter indonesiensis]